MSDSASLIKPVISRAASVMNTMMRAPNNLTPVNEPVAPVNEFMPPVEVRVGDPKIWTFWQV